MDIESENERIQAFVDKGNYHAAINLALSAMNECRRTENQAGTNQFIEIIRGIVQTLSDEFGG